VTGRTASWRKSWDGQTVGAGPVAEEGNFHQGESHAVAGGQMVQPVRSLHADRRAFVRAEFQDSTENLSNHPLSRRPPVHQAQVAGGRVELLDPDPERVSARQALRGEGQQVPGGPSHEPRRLLTHDHRNRDHLSYAEVRMVPH
jgi:hypothetical protein